MSRRLPTALPVRWIQRFLHGRSKTSAGFRPRFGLDVEDEYVESYRRAHEKGIDLGYCIAHAERVLIDGLLRYKPAYDLCEIGCGTGGYFRLYKGAGSITGVDYSPKMIDCARELVTELGLTNVELVCSPLDDFNPGRTYDAVVCRVVGHYLPHTDKHLQKISSLMKDDGIALISAQFNNSLRARIARGYWWRSRVVTTHKIVRQRLERNGLEIVCWLGRRHLIELVVRRLQAGIGTKGNVL